jgi:hypothetical protein
MKTIQINSELFWKIYNALKDAEGTLWSCDGETNPENEDLVQEIVETNETISNALDSLQPFVKLLKLEEL